MKRTTHGWKYKVLMVGCWAVILMLAFFHNMEQGTKANVDDEITPQVRSAAREVIFGVTMSNMLVTFNSDAPTVFTSSKPITGLQAGESILGIDFRPATGQLIGVGSTSRLYVINTSTGAATVIGTAAFTPALTGTEFGFDFNPTVDRIRLVSNTGQDLRLNPLTGGVAATDANLTFDATDANTGKTPNVVAAAYTNNFSGSTATTLFELDSNLDALVRQGGGAVSPNDGRLFTVGSLGINASDIAGFDISDFTGRAYAALVTPGDTASKFYSIDLTTGKATLLGTLMGTDLLRDIAVQVSGESAVAVTSSNKLISFNTNQPGTILSSVQITGLQSGENVVGIDYRPLTGQLLALGSTSRVYTINPVTGVATQVGTVPFTPALSGTNFGVDFNPTSDRIRVVSNTGQSLRLNPATGGTAATDTNVAFDAADPNAGKTPNVIGAAYTNNFAGSTVTTLYDIDSNLDVLVTQGSVGSAPVSPNAGTLFTVGALGINVMDGGGFDISQQTGAAYGAFTLMGETMSKLYTINLATGVSTLVGTIGGGETIRDFALVNKAEIVFGLTSNNMLVSFNRNVPGMLLSTVAITGLQGNENLVDIDFRPATGQLIGVGSTSRVYSINPTTGAATQVGGAQFAPLLSGTAVGIDFNPTSDRIRLVTNTGQDLRLNPNNGVTAATDGTLVFDTADVNAGKTPNVAAAGYVNNFVGSTVTTLYVIDTGVDALLTQGSVNSAPVSPNSGTLFTVGSLGVDVASVNGFDVSDFSNTAIAAFTLTGETTSKLYSINLATGMATLIGPVGGTTPISLIGLAIGNVVATDIAIAAAGPAAPVLAGQNITYTLTVTNSGPDPATNVVLSTATPANTNFQSITAPTGFTCTNPAVGGTGAITCTNPLFAANGNAAFTLVLQANANTPNGSTAALMVMVTTPTAEGANAVNNNTAMASTTINLPGPSVTGIKVTNMALTATISGQVEPVTVRVNGVAFAKAAKIKNGKLTQKGKLSNGMSLNKAIPKGTAVMLTFTNSNGGATTLSFTR